MFERRPPDRSHLPAAGASVYLLGIAGAGMTGLARILAAEGYGVVGSDLLVTPETRRLQAHGIRFVDSDDLATPAGAGLVVHTSAAPNDHPVLQAALQHPEAAVRLVVIALVRVALLLVIGRVVHEVAELPGQLAPLSVHGIGDRLQLRPNALMHVHHFFHYPPVCLRRAVGYRVHAHAAAGQLFED